MSAGLCRHLVSLLIVLSLLFLASRAPAQTITLRRAIELALNRNAPVAHADEDKAQAGYREARAAYLPRVIFGSGIGGSYGFPLSLENAAPSLFNITSQQVLYECQSQRNTSKGKSHTNRANS